MKTNFTSVALLIMLVRISKNVFGQEEEKYGTKFGFGVSLFNLADYTYTNDNEAVQSILMTIDAGKYFRIEPTIGFVRLHRNGFYVLRLGLFGKQTKSKYNLLYGVRLGKNSEDIYEIAPTLGGEYYFIKNFSVGSEVQIKSIYDNDIYPAQWGVMTNASIIVRFYL